MPGQAEPSGDARVEARPDTAKIWCELCGVALPAAFADDTFPMCGACVEEMVQAGARDTL